MDPDTQNITTSPVPKPSILPVILSIFLCISLAGVGLLAYQNWQLQKQITVLKIQSNPLPTPTPSCVIPPPECVTASGSIKPECSPPYIGEYCVSPTANWKTYTNTSFRYSINYPNDWRANSIEPGVGTMPLDDIQRGLFLAPPISAPATGMGIAIEDIHIQIEVDSAQTSGETYEEWVNSTKKSLDDPSNSISETEIASTKTIVIKTRFKIVYLFSSPDKSKFFFIETQTPTPKYRYIFDQILSTFKFLEQATPRPTCKPRPACLDATPRCMIPETSDMCPPNQKL